MEPSIFMERYPVLDLALAKSECSLSTVDEIIAALKEKIDANPDIAYIGVFDHFSHTTAIGGSVADGIVDAKNLIFCFGKAIPNPKVLALRPRSIGIVDMGDQFVLSFMQAPQDGVTKAMIGWCEALAGKSV